jgi:hypothetical protein
MQEDSICTERQPDFRDGTNLSKKLLLSTGYIYNDRVFRLSWTAVGKTSNAKQQKFTPPHPDIPSNRLKAASKSPRRFLRRIPAIPDKRGQALPE